MSPNERRNVAYGSLTEFGVCLPRCPKKHVDILEKYVVLPQEALAVCFPMPPIPTPAICTRHCIKFCLFSFERVTLYNTLVYAIFLYHVASPSRDLPYIHLQHLSKGTQGVMADI